MLYLLHKCLFFYNVCSMLDNCVYRTLSLDNIKIKTKSKQSKKKMPQKIQTIYK